MIGLRAVNHALDRKLRLPIGNSVRCRRGGALNSGGCRKSPSMRIGQQMIQAASSCRRQRNPCVELPARTELGRQAAQVGRQVVQMMRRKVGAAAKKPARDAGRIQDPQPLEKCIRFGLRVDQRARGLIACGNLSQPERGSGRSTHCCTVSRDATRRRCYASTALNTREYCCKTLVPLGMPSEQIALPTREAQIGQPRKYKDLIDAPDPLNWNGSRRAAACSTTHRPTSDSMCYSLPGLPAWTEDSHGRFDFFCLARVFSAGTLTASPLSPDSRHALVSPTRGSSARSVGSLAELCAEGVAVLSDNGRADVTMSKALSRPLVPACDWVIAGGGSRSTGQSRSAC